MTDANTSSTPIFRTVDVAQDVAITLGEPLSAEAMALAQKVGPQRYQLKPGTFADAEEIDIQLTVGAAVQQMDFSYDSSANYKEMVARYEGEIGPPTSQHGGVTEWQDPNTEFRLVQTGSSVSSVLRDRALT